MTIHLFISQALVSASIYTRVKSGGPLESQAITYKALSSQVSFLSQLFRGEFIFATAGLAANLLQTVQGLEVDGVIKVKRSQLKANINGSDGADNMISQVELSDAERAEGRNNFDFYCFLIWPFIEASWLGAMSLMMLTPPAGQEASSPWLRSRTVQNCAQLLGKTLFAQGELSYFEAVNKETLKNAYARFEDDGIVLTNKVAMDTKGGPQELMQLATEWRPQRDAQGLIMAEGRLWVLCEEISRSRLEGKNRRDGDAAVRRVLRLVDEASKGLWEQHAIDAETFDRQRSKASTVHETAGAETPKKGRQIAPSRTRANL